ncbi:hypothetical protein GW17_00029844 [Ensete ventricosum]|nr:hypothetical protein GW17_00029844 [Ensete ventricosum]
MERGTASPPRESTALESPQLATIIHFSATTATTAVDPTIPCCSSLVSPITSASTRANPATNARLHMSTPSPSPAALRRLTSSATATCSLSRHACATVAPPCPSYTAKYPYPPAANPVSSTTASSMFLRLPTRDTDPCDGHCASRTRLDGTGSARRITKPSSAPSASVSPPPSSSDGWRTGMGAGEMLEAEPELSPSARMRLWGLRFWGRERRSRQRRWWLLVLVLLEGVPSILETYVTWSFRLRLPYAAAVTRLYYNITPGRLRDRSHAGPSDSPGFTGCPPRVQGRRWAARARALNMDRLAGGRGRWGSKDPDTFGVRESGPEGSGTVAEGGRVVVGNRGGRRVHQRVPIASTFPWTPANLIPKLSEYEKVLQVSSRTTKEPELGQNQAGPEVKQRKEKTVGREHGQLLVVVFIFCCYLELTRLRRQRIHHC